MNTVYLRNHTIITSLGLTGEENFSSLLKGGTGIRLTDDPVLYPGPVPLSLVDTGKLDERVAEVLHLRKKSSPVHSFTRLEKMFILSVHQALEEQEVHPSNPRTRLVISTTKGNIDLLEERYRLVFNHKRLYLWELGRVIGTFFGFASPPLIVSNACVSGIVAVMAAARTIRAGRFDDAVVTGGDIISEFVISGFRSFQALSNEPCRPFDLDRTGLSLGEGCGTLVLSSRPPSGRAVIRVAGAATSNDANHISGPSRTGGELSWAIDRALEEAVLTPGDIDYISAHGTATVYNDEMESRALGLSGLSEVPVNSFKGYWGHTLGAAGVVESAAALSSLEHGMLIRSAGFETPGTPVPINVITATRSSALKTCLKTASGFGGCNAAIIYQKL